MKICDYGCGQEAKHQFKNGKWCCSKSYNSCPRQREKSSIQTKKEWANPDSKYNSKSYRKNRSNIIKEIWKDPDSKYNLNSQKIKEIWKDPDSKYNLNSQKIKEIWKDPDSKYNSNSWKEKMSKNLKLNREKSKTTIKKINKKYPLFSKIEKIRYNPDKPDEKEIQVHCKNHNCKNSKEKGGWFTPTKSQLSERIQAIENPRGFGESNFYCSQKCKDTCFLYGSRNDPYRDTNKPYTPAELNTFNKFILERDKEICYYCGEHHATIVHHLRPQKLEPFFALDPDYAVSVCKKCHYKKGHPTGSKHSTGNLAKIVCSVESQKFLNQK